jgi:hypothetical protein
MGPMESGEQNTQSDKVLYSDGGRDEGNSGKKLHEREEYPQGLLYFTRYDSVPIMVDALFGSPTSREFTKGELADKAGLSPKSVGNHIDVLHELGIIRNIEDTGRFSLNLNGAITWKLRQLDGLIRQAQGDDSFPTKENDTVETRQQNPNRLVNPEDDNSYQVMDSVRKQATRSGRYAD